MIHAKFFLGNEPDKSILTIEFMGVQTFKELSTILNRALNCNPEFNNDWFELSDKLDKFILNQRTSV